MTMVSGLSELRHYEFKTESAVFFSKLGMGVVHV